MNKNPVFTAVLLFAGNGDRMHSVHKKQYMELCGEKIIVHTIRAFENNANINHIVLVVSKDETLNTVEICKENGFKKISSITNGGRERFISAYNGVLMSPPDTDYVLIHDGVRPLVSQESIDLSCMNVISTGACILAVPVKETIKKADKNGYVCETPERRNLWAVQTPQTFSLTLLKNAYKELYKTFKNYGMDASMITDDSIVVENMTNAKVKIIRGDEKNIKITTPPDMIIAEAFLKDMKKEN